MYEKNGPRFRSLFHLLVLITTLVWAVIGCDVQFPEETPELRLEISELRFYPSKAFVSPGQEIIVFVDVISNGPVSYSWTVDGGEIVEGQSSSVIVYRAPDKPGIYSIRVKVSSDNHSVEREIAFTVEEVPTSTAIPAVEIPTQTPTLTLTPTSTEIAATSTGVPDLTPTVSTPEPQCDSFRPPLDGAADFAGTVKIVTLENCVTGLPNNFTLAGTYGGIPEDIDIWVLVYPTNSKYYPQSPDVCAGEKPSQAGGKWEVPIALGGPPQQYDIVAVLADKDASQFFSDWLRQGCNTGSFPGIPANQLESMNITEKDHITVSTITSEPTPLSCDSSVCIEHPQAGEEVTCQTRVTGTLLEPLQADQSIWFILRPDGSEAYFPQEVIVSDDNWEVIASIGICPEDNPAETNLNLEFDLYIGIADADADRVFKSYLETVDDKRLGSGMPDLPSGYKIQDRIMVVRK